VANGQSNQRTPTIHGRKRKKAQTYKRVMGLNGAQVKETCSKKDQKTNKKKTPKNTHPQQQPPQKTGKRTEGLKANRRS